MVTHKKNRTFATSDYPIFVYNSGLSNFSGLRHAIFSIKQNLAKILPGEFYPNIKDNVPNLENDVPNKGMRNF